MFDIFVILFIIILPIINVNQYPQEMIQSVFLIFGTIFLMCIGYMQKAKREYRNIPLALLTILSLIYLFAKNWHVGSLSCNWLNWYLMNEGFLYLFFGIFLIKTIVTYAKRYRFYYVALITVIAFWLWNYCLDMHGWGKGWTMTPLLAFSIGGVLTLARHAKTRICSIGIGLIGLSAVIYKWHWLWGVKWRARPDFWKYTVHRVITSKWLGHGFDQGLNAKDGLVSVRMKEAVPFIQKWLGGWRNNDYLEIAEYLGVIALMLITWFIIQTLLGSKANLAYFLFVSAIIMCFFQRSMFHPVKAGLILIITSLVLLEKRVKICQ